MKSSASSSSSLIKSKPKDACIFDQGAGNESYAFAADAWLFVIARVRKRHMRLPEVETLRLFWISGHYFSNVAGLFSDSAATAERDRRVVPWLGGLHTFWIMWSHEMVVKPSKWPNRPEGIGSIPVLPRNTKVNTIETSSFRSQHKFLLSSASFLTKKTSWRLHPENVVLRHLWTLQNLHRCTTSTPVFTRSFAMSHPTFWHNKTFFYPIGNTPPVCLTEHVPPEQDATILLLGCGDPRSILYTVAIDHGAREFLVYTMCILLL